MYIELLQQLGLAQNEARIYESLLRGGNASVGQISAHSQVHRRNVYDSLNRLLEKGLVFEIRGSRENRYQAVDPRKLAELLQEKERELAKAMPSLEGLYAGIPRTEEVYIYHGKEGWKNYARDILRIGKDVHGIGAKAPFNRDNFPGFFDRFVEDMRQAGFRWYNIYDHEVKGTKYEGHLDPDYRFLPPEFSSPSSTMILDDRAFFFSRITLGQYEDDYTFSVIINKQIADSLRAWFRFMWERCEKPSKKPALS